MWREKNFFNDILIKVYYADLLIHYQSFTCLRDICDCIHIIISNIIIIIIIGDWNERVLVFRRPSKMWMVTSCHSELIPYCLESIIYIITSKFIYGSHLVLSFYLLIRFATATTVGFIVQIILYFGVVPSCICDCISFDGNGHRVWRTAFVRYIHIFLLFYLLLVLLLLFSFPSSIHNINFVVIIRIFRFIFLIRFLHNRIHRNGLAHSYTP